MLFLCPSTHPCLQIDLRGQDPAAKVGHTCDAFQFMLDHGGGPKERVLVYDCNQHPPADPEPHITINSFATLEEALVQLRTQPIGAEFSQLSVRYISSFLTD